MESVRVIIAGSRTFTDYELLAAKMDTLTKNLDFTEVEVVSGGARGADLLGERWALLSEVPIAHFLAEWDRYGRSAGYKRNEDMARYATHLVAFWDGKSRGTEHMIAMARSMCLEIRIVMTAVREKNNRRSIHDEVVWI